MTRQHSSASRFTSGTEKQWKIEFHGEFLPEFRQFPETVRRRIYALVEVLREFGPQLGRPHVDTLKGSKHLQMKELRFYADEGVWRVAFAFDIQRNATLLVGGDKAGVSQAKFYRGLIQTADRRFDQHLEEIRKKGGG